MENKETSIVIVGHIDHGKSTLIGRLLYDTGSLSPDRMDEVRKVSKELGKDFEFAFLVDQLKEEREGELTIDTTQAFFKTKKRRYVIIDAPGHAEFIKNMVTGATQAEAAVMIISAEKGMEEQTKRHAYILSLLGMSRVIVAVNKMDCVGYDQSIYESVRREAEEFLGRVGVKPSVFIPISASLGAGIAKKDKQMKWYGGPSLVDALDAVVPRKRHRERPLRFPVQDIYSIDGERILVGKVASGEVRQGQTAKLLPADAEVTIESIKVFQEKRTQASEGENIGLVVTTSADIKRGDVICANNNGPALTNRFKGNVFWMCEAPLSVGRTLTVRCATQEAFCTVQKIETRLDSSTLEELGKDCRELGLNEVGVVIFESTAPVVVEKFSFVEELGRFVLESGDTFLGSGTISHPGI
ncbi:MAG: GTP-binding protein [Candidatus Omnitrophota bacterium]